MLKAVRERLATYLPEDDLAGAMKMLEERGWDANRNGVLATRATDGKRDWGKITVAALRRACGGGLAPGRLACRL